MIQEIICMGMRKCDKKGNMGKKGIIIKEVTTVDNWSLIPAGISRRQYRCASELLH